MKKNAPLFTLFILFTDKIVGKTVPRIGAAARSCDRFLCAAGLTAALFFTPLLLQGQESVSGSSDGPKNSGSRELTLENLLQDNGSTPMVSTVELTGLRKTKRRVLDSLIIIEAGKPLTEERLEETEQNLKKTSLFEKISFFYRRGQEGYAVEIALKEKATLIPIPFFSASDGQFSYGLTLFDANLLGLRKQFVASAMMSGTEPYGSMGYIDPTIADSTATWVIFISGGPNTREAAYPDGENYRVYKGTDARVSTRLRVRTQRKLQPSLSFMYEQTSVDADWEDSLAEPANSAIAAPGVGLSYEDSYFVEYFNRGFTADVEYSYAFLLNDSYDDSGGEGNALEAEIGWTAAFFTDHRFSLNVGAGYSEFPVPSLNELSGAGYRVLPFRRAVGREFAAGSVSYEFPFYSPGWGTCTATFFFDGGAYEPEKNEREYFYGPGGGFLVYLKKVAIPALGVNFGYNVPTGTLQTSVVIGMNM